MGWLDIFTGGATTALKSLGNAANGFLDRWVPKKMSEKEKAEVFLERLDRDIDKEKMNIKDIADARKMFMVEMQTQKQPWFVRLMMGLYRPLAGYCALWVAFYPYFRALFNEWFGWSLPEVTLEQVIYLAIMGVVTTIIIFFFGSAHKGGMSAPDRKPGE